MARENKRKTVRLNSRRYAELLAATLPVRIETAEQHQRMLDSADDLFRRGEQLSTEEVELLKLLAHLIQDYERKTYPLRKAEPLEVLLDLMEVNELKQSDLWPVLKSKSVTSEIVNGKRGISKANAKALAEFFHISTEVFL